MRQVFLDLFPLFLVCLAAATFNFFYRQGASPFSRVVIWALSIALMLAIYLGEFLTGKTLTDWVRNEIGEQYCKRWEAERCKVFRRDQNEEFQKDQLARIEADRRAAIGAEKQRNEADWRTASDTNSPESYRAYLLTHPDGIYALKARQALASFYQDDNDWLTAKADNEIDKYQAYMKAHPSGQHLAEARAAVSLIEQDDRDWDSARSVGKPENYLRIRPSGRHVTEARAAAAALAQDNADWAAALANNTPEIYLAEHPRGRHVEEARRLQQQQATRATCADRARAGLRPELDRIVGSISAVGSTTGTKYFYGESPNPKSVALCLNWTATSPFSEAWGAGFSNAALAGTPRAGPIDSDAMYRCAYSKTSGQQCTCQIVHRNGAAVLEIPTGWRAPCG
jgi:hypothetical protein